MACDINLSATLTKRWIFSKLLNKCHRSFYKTLQLESNGLHNLIKGHTCFKGKGSLIDLILTNRKFSFTNTQSFETGLSDHHYMVSKLLSRNLNRNNWFTVILKTSILKVSKMIYGKIWLPVTDHMKNLIENLLRY